MKNKGIILLVIIIIIAIVVAISVNLNKGEETEKSNQAESYSLKYGDIDITPGKVFKEEEISEDYNYYEIESCAFDGMDKVYTYSGVEITVAEIDGVDTIYSVYFLDENTETTEGIKISDNKEKMIETYGDSYESSVENSYSYKKDNVIISFITENDIIISIEYTLDTNN